MTFHSVMHATGEWKPRLPAGERIYAIGDVHGRLDLLEALVATIRADVAVRPAARVKILLLGDIIDRGDDSAVLIAHCMAFSRHTADFIVLKGNHEAMMVQASRGSRLAMRVWLANGGAATLYSFGIDADLIDEGDPARLLTALRAHVPRATIEWLDRLPVHHRVGDYFFVHAGVRPGIALERQRVEDMLWIREEFTEDRTDHAMMIVHGHSEEEAGPDIWPNRIGLDTAAYRTDVLTALAIEGTERWTLRTAPDDGPLRTGVTPLDDAVEAILAPTVIPVSPAADPVRRKGRAGLAAALTVGVVLASVIGLRAPHPEPRSHDAPAVQRPVLRAPPAEPVALLQPAPPAVQGLSQDAPRQRRATSQARPPRRAAVQMAERSIGTRHSDARDRPAQRPAGTPHEASTPPDAGASAVMVAQASVDAPQPAPPVMRRATFAAPVEIAARRVDDDQVRRREAIDLIRSLRRQ